MKLIDKIWEFLFEFFGKSQSAFESIETIPINNIYSDPHIYNIMCDNDCDGKCGDKCKNGETCSCGIKDNKVTIFKSKKEKRKIYHVVPAPEGGWLVKEQKNKKPCLKENRKSDAVRCAKELAKKAKLGQVIIHKKDGKIQTEYTYGEDPKNSKG